MSLKDITITGSIGSIATQSYGQRTYVSSTDEQSFPIEQVTGSYAGAWPNFKLRGLTTSNSASNTTVDLVVNVTQSWPASNTTPLGIVSYIHDTMEEFINGEFSGSRYTVSDGNLNDEQCEQFLTVNTTSTSYSMFPYVSTYADGEITFDSLGIFLDKRTIPSNGQFLMHYKANTQTDVIPPPTFREIDYIKVARIDQEGDDNTLSLQELTHFIWTDSTTGKIDLTILNISEYSTYYLYEVKSKVLSRTTSYADDNILNYAFSASSAGSMNANTSPYYLGTWNIINNATGQFGGTYYRFALTPNCNIRYTASINITNPNGSPVSFNFGFWSSPDLSTSYTPIQISSLINLDASATTTITLSGSTSTQFFGQMFHWLETKNNTLPLTINNASWVITQSQAPQLSTSSITIEPYLLSTFRNSDCDVLMNNYSQNDISQTHQKVLYDDGGTIPSNLNQIKAGIAEQAEINDYLYSFSANILPRYIGVKTTSKDINLPFITGLSNEEISLLNSSSLRDDYVSLPNVEYRTQYFAYFEKISDNFPKNNYASKAYISKLIGPEGDIIPLDSDNRYIIDVETIFPNDSNVKLYYISFAFDPDANLSEESKYHDTIIDEPAVYYQSYFYFRPQLIDTSSLLHVSMSGRFDLDLFDPRVLEATTTTLQPYVQQGSLLNSRFNLYSVEDGDAYSLYLKYNTLFTGSATAAAADSLVSNGYLMGLALTLTNPFITSSIPSSSFRSYNDYWPIRFNTTSTSSNYEVDTSFLPIRPGDRVRVFNAVLKDDQNQTKYVDDTDVLFFADLAGEDNFNFTAQRGLVSYDRKIESIVVNRPSIYIPVYNP
jgi:hypothetical protein